MKKLTDKERTKIKHTGIRSLKPHEPWQVVVLGVICTNCGKGEIADDELPVGWMSVDVGHVHEKHYWRGSGARTLCDECTDAPVSFVLDNEIPF